MSIQTNTERGIPERSSLAGAGNGALGRAIAHRIGEARYRLWFEGRTRFRWDDTLLTVGVPNRHYEDWIHKTFGSEVVQAATEILGQPAQVQFRIDPELFRAARQEQEEARQQHAQASTAVPATRSGPSYEVDEPTVAPAQSSASLVEDHSPRTERGSRPRSGPTKEKANTTSKPKAKPTPLAKKGARRRWHKLKEFVVGACNRVAHASALSVVEGPGEGPNPLVLYGPVGTGKTHLLEGIYVGLRQSHPHWRVCFVTSEDFTNRFVQAMRLGKLHHFRKYFRDCDALLLDDLHFLSRKRATQEEFLHTFDALLPEGRQMVMTSDCHPRLSEDLTPELTDRLLGGAVWGLSPPDPDTRLGILRNRSQGVPDEILLFLAEQLRGNARELEGALHSIQHYSRVTGRPVDIRLVREALADLLRHAVRVVRTEDVDRVICSVLRMQEGSLQSKSRIWAISHPRMVAMYLARKHTTSSYGEIGTHFGGRNHSTVVAAEKKVRGWLAEDAELVLGQLHIRVREIIERVERDLFR